jgi:hypothetical protein
MADYTPTVDFTAASGGYTPTVGFSISTLPVTLGASIDAELISAGKVSSADAAVQSAAIRLAGSDAALATDSALTCAADVADLAKERIIRDDALENIDFVASTPQAVYEIQPAALLTLIEAFDADTSQFTRYTEGTPGTVTIAGGTLSVVNSTTSARNDILVTGDDITLPQLCVSADVIGKTSVAATYDNFGVGIAKDASNFIFASVDKKANIVRVQVKISGVNTFGSSAAYSIPASFKLALSIIGNYATVWLASGTTLVPITSYDFSSKINLRTAALTGWKPALSVASSGSASTWVIDNLKAGAYGTVGMRDQTFVTTDDGTPYIDGNTCYLMATGNDAAGNSTCGLYAFDLESYEVSCCATYMFERSGVKYSDVAGHIIKADGYYRVLISSWGNGFGNDLSVYYTTTTAELLSGQHLITGLTKLTLPYQTSGKCAYDPMMYWSGSEWRMAYIVCDNLTFAGSPFYPALATSTDLSTWTGVANDSANKIYEGAKIVKTPAGYYITAGSATNARLYDENLSFVGDVQAAFSGGSSTQPHALILYRGSKYVLVTFNDQKPPGITSAWTWGQLIVQDGAIPQIACNSVVAYQSELNANMGASLATRGAISPGADASVGGSVELAAASSASVGAAVGLNTSCAGVLAPQPVTVELQLAPTACLQKTMYIGRFLAPSATVKIAGSFSELTLTAQTYLSAPGQAATSTDARVSVRGIYTARLGAHLSEQPAVTAAAESSIALAKSRFIVAAAQLQKERVRTSRTNAWLKIQPTMTTGIDADLGAEEGVTTHAAAQLQKEFAKSTTSNARVSIRPTLATDIAALLGERNTPSVFAAAQLAVTRIRTPRTNAWITARRTPTTGVDLYLGEQLVLIADANAALQKAYAETTATSAYLYLGQSATAELNAYVAERHALTAGSNALKTRTATKTPRANARLTAIRTPASGADARLGAVLAKTAGSDAVLQDTQAHTFTASALAYLSGTKTADADSYVAERHTRAASGNALKTRAGLKTPRAHAFIRKAASNVADIDARLGITLRLNPSADSAIKGSATLAVSITGYLYQTEERALEVEAQIAKAARVSLTSASVLAKMRTRTPRANAWLRRPGAITPSADSDLGLRRGGTLAASSCVQGDRTASLGAMALLSGSRATASNALLQRVATRLYGADSAIQGELTAVASANALVSGEGQAFTAGADAAIYPRPFRSHYTGAGAILEAA